MNNQLSIEVSDSCNAKVMRLFDTSNYCDEVVENYLIEVLPVNKSVWLTFNVAKNFSLALNSANLRYKRVTEESSLADLPDGIYEIKQSIKPNAYTVVHYYHLRAVELRNNMKVEWDKLVKDTCKLSRTEFEENRDKLREIDEYIMAAKYSVEECHDKTVGKEQYEWAKKLLEVYNNDCGC